MRIMREVNPDFWGEAGEVEGGASLAPWSAWFELPWSVEASVADSAFDSGCWCCQSTAAVSESTAAVSWDCACRMSLNEFAILSSSLVGAMVSIEQAVPGCRFSQQIIKGQEVVPCKCKKLVVVLRTAAIGYLKCKLVRSGGGEERGAGLLAASSHQQCLTSVPYATQVTTV